MEKICAINSQQDVTEVSGQDKKSNKMVMVKLFLKLDERFSRGLSRSFWRKHRIEKPVFTWKEAWCFVSNSSRVSDLQFESSHWDEMLPLCS